MLASREWVDLKGSCRDGFDEPHELLDFVKNDSDILEVSQPSFNYRGRLVVRNVSHARRLFKVLISDFVIHLSKIPHKNRFRF